MKKLVLILFQFMLLLSCSKEYPLDVKVPEVNEGAPQYLGFDFRQVSHQYEDHTDHIYFVNKSPGMQSEGGQHWVFKSPHLEGQEVGFAIISHPDCFSGDCEVILFLHASNGTENSGAVQFYKHYKNQNYQTPYVFVFANGIGADQGYNLSTGVWKERKNRISGDTIKPLVVLKELVGGIIEDQQHFYFISKDISKWSVFGFSAGAAASMGVYAHIEFIESEYQPHRIFPFGGWINPNALSDYFDFNSGYEKILAHHIEGPELVISNHIQDDVDCEGFTTYEQVVPFMRRMEAAGIKFSFLGGLDTVEEPCALKEDGSKTNRTHSSSFYLRQTLNNSAVIISSNAPKYFEESDYFGEILFGPN